MCYQVYQVHASCADAETNGRRSRLHPIHSICPYMCCAGPGSRGICRIECFLVEKRQKRQQRGFWGEGEVVATSKSILVFDK